ncbi:MAG TPA: ABC transporter ATP-binding protein [Acidimicrobiales bacterium]|nr:ABC transporter ATP-binding protein [Acidimicrobiales bacterium]
MTAQSAPVLEMHELRTWFATPEGPLRAVDGVSLGVEPGRCLGVVGESGSGKTVLLRSIVGLLPRRAIASTGGTVCFEGLELAGAPPAVIRDVRGRRIGMVFQDPMTSLNPVMRVGTQLTDGMRHHLGVGRQEARRRARALLEAVGIPDPERRLRDYPHQLSGGMRQRVTIAIALACDPSLLLADEPTTALDVTVQSQILRLLGRLRRQRNMAVILVTHDMGVVAGSTDDLAVMYAGKVVEQGPTATVFSATRHPYTRALLEAIPRADARPGERLATIPGQPPSLVDPPSGCRFAPRCPRAADRCRAEEPPLAGADGHRFACWFPLGDPEPPAAAT